MDNQYWVKYYEIHHEPFEPSSFAKFALKYINEGETLLELGCGNGRDALFFGANGVKTIALDQCENIITSLNEKNYKNVDFRCEDFTLPQGSFNHNHVYSRFTLHSIPDDLASMVLGFTRAYLNGYFFIEVRSDYDALAGKKTDHFRRFVNFDELLKEMLKLGFSIEYAEIGKGFSKYESKFGVDYNEDDPTLIRIVAS